jgi:hypothetical protein
MPNSDYNDIFTTTLESRTGELADSVSENNALLTFLKKHGNLHPVDGGSKILEELEYGEGDLTWYSGYQTITYSPKQLFTAAEYALKLCAVPVAISGEDMLKNSGKERTLNLFDKRIENAFKTMKNQLAAGLYSDGTGSSGKEIGGLKYLVADDPTSGTVGGINRATSGNEFWRNKSITADSALSVQTIGKAMNDMWLQLCRNGEHPDVIVASNDMYSLFDNSLTQFQRFTDPKLAEAGFENLKFKSAQVIFEGGHCPDKHMYFLNTKYIYLRPHKDRNMKVINGNRMAINQDALYNIVGWAGNMTMSNAELQGVLIDAASASGSGSN